MKSTAAKKSLEIIRNIFNNSIFYKISDMGNKT